MKTSPSGEARRRWVLLLLATAVVLVAGNPVAGSSVTGDAGLDTSLPETESQVTVEGRGRFADLRVTVNQTRNLLNQAVSITWTGGRPTIVGPSRFAGNYLQVMQCWGDPDATVPANPGPPPEQCVAGATNGVLGGVPGSPFPAGSFTTERIMSRNTWENFDAAAGAFDERTGYVWAPFRGVDGTTVGVHKDPKFNPDIQGGSFWLNPLFNIVTTNEVAASATGPNGEGAELMELLTGVESSGLGCGQRVQALADGTTKLPRCWLVVVPRGTPEEENVGTPFADSAERYGVMTSPLNPQAWQNRIAIELQFDPVESPCDLGADQRRIVGSELAAPAVSSWQPKLCSVPGVLPFAYGNVADASARQQLTLATPGGPGLVVVSRPVAPDGIDPDSPIVYAPLTLSGVAIGLNVERNPKPDADSEARSVAGTRVARLNLTPRMVAKLLTQSYKGQVSIKTTPDYEWMAENPDHLGVDPDFVQYNPEFAELQIAGGKNFGGLVLPAGNSDAAQLVWEYVLADPEARAWLDGEADPFGMVVNPVYATEAARNPTGAAFGDPVPTTFPKSDPHCFQGPPQGATHDVVPPPLCGTDWLPYALTLRDAARITRAADDGAKIVEDAFATTPDKVYKRDIPQPLGSRAILSLVDTATAFQYGIQTAWLSRPGDDGDVRTFIGATGSTLTAAVDAMKPGTELAVLEPDHSADVELAYPLTAISYAAVKPLALDEESRHDYAAFVEYASGAGQEPGLERGKLPNGYAPLPPALQTQARNAARSIVDLTAPAPETPPAAPPASPTPPTEHVMPAAELVPRAPVELAGASDVDPATLVAAPAVLTDAPSADLPLARTIAVTPAVGVPTSRLALPALVALALVSVLVALEITKRPRTAAAAPDSHDASELT